jgi:glutamate racemase
MSERQAASGAAREQQAAPDLAPVGVFDSGVGGLTILRDLLRELPAERYIYFGDTGNCPYGVRTESEIQALAISAMRLLLDRGAKLIVIACNAASVAALAALRATYPDTPFVGTVPAVKPAAARTRIGRIGVAATEVSAHSDYLKRLVADHANGVEVLAAGCPRLVTLAEAGILDGPEAEAAVRDYIAPMLAAGIDELVLGCTHFPAVRAVFERVAGPAVEVIDSGAAIARRARFVLAEQRRLADSEGGPTDRPRPPDERDEFWCSGDVAQFERVAAAILGSPVTARLAPAMRAAPVERSPLR